MTTLYRNASLGKLPPRVSATSEPYGFHRGIPGYAPTPLVATHALAERLGLGRVLVKDESQRFGLPSFKLLGASWATHRALAARTGRGLDGWASTVDLARELVRASPFTLVAATDGNHGRAVARIAMLLGFGAKVFVPRGTAAARIRAIESEGASCTVVNGDYDATIARSAEEAGERCLVIDDTSWPGYEEIPGWVIEGYRTIFEEVDEQLGARPTQAFVPIGVGALGAAAVDFYKRDGSATVVFGVEPERAACVLESLRRGELTTIPGPQDSIMAGLNCGTPSSIAFPILLAGLDYSIAVTDARAEEAMRSLSECGIISGETGAAALAGLEALLSLPDADRIRQETGLDRNATVLLLSTEGATDPESYERIVGRRASVSERSSRRNAGGA